MRRADRLFQIVETLRRHRRGVLTARQLAERLEVSERTVYRDLADLMQSGVPIRGEADVGYALERGFDIPPLMFTADEIAALHLGAGMVKAVADAQLREAAEAALAKIEGVLPEKLKDRLKKPHLFAPTFHFTPPSDALLVLRRAVEEKHLVRFSYARRDGTPSLRTVRPLCLAYFQPQWILAAYCELRCEFRNFRLDRISDLETLPTTFVDEPGKALDDFLAQVSAAS